MNTISIGIDTGGTFTDLMLIDVRTIQPSDGHLPVDEMVQHMDGGTRGVLRFSLHLYNTPNDVDRVLDLTQ